MIEPATRGVEIRSSFIRDTRVRSDPAEILAAWAGAAAGAGMRAGPGLVLMGLTDPPCILASDACRTAHDSASITRLMAGCLRFLTLIQSQVRGR